MYIGNFIIYIVIPHFAEMEVQYNIINSFFKKIF